MASRTLEITFLGDASSAQNAMRQVANAGEQLQAKVSGLAGSISHAAATMAGFLGAQVLGKAPAAIGSVIDRASDLQLQATKAATVFGDSLAEVQRWADANAHGMGLVRADAVNLAAGLADLLVPMGMTRDAAADMATKTVGLSGALAEWSGGQKSAAEVADILTKSYLGETDGLKALGISISAADVSARLAAKGQKDLAGAALEQARALAIQELVFEKSTDAQAAYENGSGKLARRKAELTAKFRELRDVIAVNVVPVMLQVAAVVTDRLIPVLDTAAVWLGVNIPKAVDALKPVAETLQNAFSFLVDHKDALIAAMSGVAATIAAVLVPATWAWVAAETAKAAALIASAAAFVVANAPLIALAAAIGAVVAGIVLLVQHWDQVTAKFPVLGEVVDAVRERAAQFADWMQGPFLDGVRAGAEGAREVFNRVGEAITTVVEAIKPTLDRLLPPAIAVFKAQFTIAKEAVELALGLIRVNIETVLGVVRGIIQTATALWRGDWQGAMDGMKATVDAVWTGIKDTFGQFEGFIRGIAPAVKTAASEVGRAVLDGIKDGVSGAVAFATDMAANLAAAVGDAVKRVINAEVIDRINSSLSFTIPGKLGIPDITIDAPDIPHLAAGGIVTRPTLALVGEAGPEAVVPLSRSRAVAAPVVEVHIHGDVLARNADEARIAGRNIGQGVVAALRSAGYA